MESKTLTKERNGKERKEKGEKERRKGRRKGEKEGGKKRGKINEYENKTKER